jgi:glutamate-1-semialdehyde 2,1-aminomutase
MYTFEKSKELYERSCHSLAGGVGSSFRKEMKPLPLFMKSGNGSRLLDVDGNEYIDFGVHFGPLILGHSDPDVLDAARAQLEKGYYYGAQHPLEIALSELMQDIIPCADLVQFSNTGSEAVHLALRLSRAYTGKKKIVKFIGHYHGWHDNILVSVHPGEKDPASLIRFRGQAESLGQSERVLDDIIVLPWNDFEAISDAIDLYKDEIAAVIMEPMMGNSGVIFPQSGYLQRVRNLTEENNIVFIFDEMITGFRIALGGAQEYFGVVPDLAVYGKALGGGFPISGIAGKKEIMDLIAQGKVRHSGSYNTNPLSMAGAYAVVSKLKNNPAIFTGMNQLGEKLISSIRTLAGEAKMDVLVQGPGPIFFVYFTDLPAISNYADYERQNFELRSSFGEELTLRGIMPNPGGRWYLSAAHTAEDIEVTISKIREVLDILKK